MSLRSPDMAGVALGTAFSILLLASITQGLRDVEILHDEKVEGVVGQNVTLSCTVKSNSAVTIVNVEWRKNGDTKLAVYTPGHGLHLFWPNITMQTENKSMASHLRLCGVTTQDSGIYVCCITSFPQGSLCSQTVLKITVSSLLDNVGITCDAHPAFEVHAGENVTIKCKLFPDAKYKWTKNEALVSDNESLELCFAADAHTGVYTLTVTIGDKAVHKEFVITVLTASTSSRTDLWTVPSPSNSTEEGGMESAGGGLTASPTAHTDVTWAAKMAPATTSHTQLTISPRSLLPTNKWAAMHPPHQVTGKRSSDQPTPRRMSRCEMILAQPQPRTPDVRRGLLRMKWTDSSFSRLRLDALEPGRHVDRKRATCSAGGRRDTRLSLSAKRYEGRTEPSGGVGHSCSSPGVDSCLRLSLLETETEEEVWSTACVQTPSSSSQVHRCRTP
ncbi:uncharacterized protein AB9W97_010432 isoform 4-T6 [Spinachia spinachia]